MKIITDRRRTGGVIGKLHFRSLSEIEIDKSDLEKYGILRNMARDITGKIISFHVVFFKKTV